MRRSQNEPFARAGAGKCCALPGSAVLASGGEADKGNEEVLKTDLQTASKRQAEIAEMTIRILERN